jgi:hypothetical protein
VRDYYPIIDQRVDAVVQEIGCSRVPILLVHPVEDHVHIDAALFRPADRLDNLRARKSVRLNEKFRSGGINLLNDQGRAVLPRRETRTQLATGGWSSQHQGGQERKLYAPIH